MSEKLKILIGISSIVATNKSLRKAMDTYFWLKHYHDSGVVAQKYSAQLARQCNISERTLWTRLKIMKSYDLIKTRDGIIYLASFDDVCKQFDIQKKFYYVKYDNDEEISLEHLLMAKAVFEGKKRQRRAFRFHAKKFGIDRLLCDVTGSRDLQRQAVLRACITAFTNPEFYHESEISILNRLNPDDNYSCNKLAGMFNLKSAASGSYIKGILTKRKLISVQKRLFESERKIRESILGVVYYSRKTAKTFLIMTDNIELV